MAEKRKERGLQDLLASTALNGGRAIGEPVEDVLRRRPSRAKRRRRWEEEQRAQMVTYRGIPPELREGLKRVAAELGITVSEVARLFLEYGLEAYQTGALEIELATVETKKTAFPGE